MRRILLIFFAVGEMMPLAAPVFADPPFQSPGGDDTPFGPHCSNRFANDLSTVSGERSEEESI
jgi:hypothetical protein